MSGLWKTQNLSNIIINSKSLIVIFTQDQHLDTLNNLHVLNALD